MRIVEASIDLDLAPQDILDVFIKQEHLKAWWGVDRSLIELKPGGLYSLVWQKKENCVEYVSTGMKPIQTFFENNGSYHSDHYSVNDSLLFSAKGTWTVSNDTLIMKQTSPNVATYRLKTEIINDVVTFSGKLDFDEDGVDDDDYYGIQRKQNSPH